MVGSTTPGQSACRPTRMSSTWRAFDGLPSTFCCWKSSPMIDYRPSFTDAASRPSLSVTLSRLTVCAFAQAVIEGVRTRSGMTQRRECGRAWSARGVRTTTRSTVATGFRSPDDFGTIHGTVLRKSMRQPRFERGTFGSGGRRSIQLSYWRVRCCNNLANDCLLLKPFRLPFVMANEMGKTFLQGLRVLLDTVLHDIRAMPGLPKMAVGLLDHGR